MRWPMHQYAALVWHQGPVTRVPHGQSMRNEWRLTIKKRITLTKEKNNTYKQRTLWAFIQRIKRAWNGYQRKPKNGIRSSHVGLCGTRVTGPLRRKNLLHPLTFCIQYERLQHSMYTLSHLVHNMSYRNIPCTHVDILYTIWTLATFHVHALTVCTQYEHYNIPCTDVDRLYKIWTLATFHVHTLTLCTQYERVQHSMYTRWQLVHNMNACNIPCTHFDTLYPIWARAAFHVYTLTACTQYQRLQHLMYTLWQIVHNMNASNIPCTHFDSLYTIWTLATFHVHTKAMFRRDSEFWKLPSELNLSFYQNYVGESGVMPASFLLALISIQH